MLDEPERARWVELKRLLDEVTAENERLRAKIKELEQRQSPDSDEPGDPPQR